MINCEYLLDQCWAMLNRKYEEAYGERNHGYDKPEFRFVLSAEQIRALKSYVANKKYGESAFLGISNQMLFGHPLLEQRRTPYLESHGIRHEKRGGLNPPRIHCY